MEIKANLLFKHAKYFLILSEKLHIDETIGVGVPNMPTNVRGTQSNVDSVLIRWDRGETGAADRVITYVVGYIEVDARSKEKYATFNVDSTQYVVKKLKPNTQYRFFVRGVNKNGRSLPSLLSDVVRTKALKPTGKESEMHSMYSTN